MYYAALIIRWILCISYCAFVLIGCLVRPSRHLTTVNVPDRVRAIRVLTKWPALVYCIASPFLDALAGERDTWWMYLGYVLDLVTWYMYRNTDDDDDSMKRLKDNVKEKVEQIGSKLVVVAEPA